MLSRAARELPLACTLTGAEQLRRRERWLSLAERALVAKAVTEGGVELRYLAKPGVLSELTQLAGLETECCAFAAWNVGEDRDTIVLEVVTERANAPAVWALLDEPPAAGQSRAQ